MTVQKIDEAASLLAEAVNRTPVLTSRTLDKITGGQFFLKCENFQRAGSFKFRGAYNAIYLALKKVYPSPERKPRILTYSSGNHAQAAALAGSLLGVSVSVIMPKDAPEIKKAATAGYGAHIIPYDRHKASREAIAREMTAKDDYILIPPYDSEDVIAGQGTAAKELIEEAGSLDYLFTPCGGGGLLSGSALCAKRMLPGCKVIGVEPLLADDAARSFRTGVIQTAHSPDTIADGLRTPSLGVLPFEIIKQYVDDIITVTEDEIISTMYFIWTRLKIIAEPSAAAGLAPALHHKLPAGGKRAGVIISGGNVDMNMALGCFIDTPDAAVKGSVR